MIRQFDIRVKDNGVTELFGERKAEDNGDSGRVDECVKDSTQDVKLYENEGPEPLRARPG